MTRDPKKFREIARVCAVLSQSAPNVKERETFATLAETWRGMPPLPRVSAPCSIRSLQKKLSRVTRSASLPESDFDESRRLGIQPADRSRLFISGFPRLRPKPHPGLIDDAIHAVHGDEHGCLAVPPIGHGETGFRTGNNNIAIVDDFDAEVTTASLSRWPPPPFLAHGVPYAQSLARYHVWKAGIWYGT